MAAELETLVVAAYYFAARLPVARRGRPPKVRDAELVALARGLKIGKVLTDLDQSGGKMDRPALAEAIERIKAKESDGLLVARLDRFARTLIGGLQTLQEIEGWAASSSLQMDCLTRRATSAGSQRTSCSRWPTSS